jgi:hypothetical protein
MDELGYIEFLCHDRPRRDDPIDKGMTIHGDIMTELAQHIHGEDLVRIGRKIDILIGSIVIQHLEAANDHSVLVRDVAALLRKRITEKMREAGIIPPLEAS